MRHIGSIFLALILAPATWVLTGIGVSKFAEAQADSSGFGVGLTLGLAAILGAGLCYTVLIFPRISPLGPVLAGIAFLGLVVWRVGDVAGFNRVVPADVLNVDSALRNPANGYAALLALPLLATLFSLRRWRRHEYPAEYVASMAPAYVNPNYPDADYPTPTYPAPDYPTPAYPSYPAAGMEDSTWPFSPEATRRL